MVTHAQIKSACEFVTKTLTYPQLIMSLMHLERSYFLFAGHMTSSYDYQHYRQATRLGVALLAGENVPRGTDALRSCIPLGVPGTGGTPRRRAA